jgi:hypothetical protein
MPVGQVKDTYAHYTGPDDPHFPYPRGVMNQGADARRAYFEAHQARWTIAAVCKVCQRELIAEEVTAHAHKHMSSRLRSFAREWEALPNATRAEFMAYIKEYS